MSSSENSGMEVAAPIQVIFEKDVESSIEPPCEEWSSLILELPEENVKKVLYAEGLYQPGSGEICTKYIPMSASSVLRHPYYNYPGVLDPGIKEALLHPIPKIIYSDDGQELYTAVCKEMNICPIKSFYRQLLEDTIDLRYYGVNPVAFRALAMALKLNRIVKVLNLTDNWVPEDGCYHLGMMLVDNITLRELNLYGCRIGPEGARRLCDSLHLNRSLKVLNLARNQLGDQGVAYLAKAIFKGADVANVNLSYNNLTANALLSLAEAFETNNKFTHLNLSWNSIQSPNAVFTLCQRLRENAQFEELNLSWNSLSGLRVGNAIKILLKNPNVRRIILTNNKLEGKAINSIASDLATAKYLETIDLSYNPLTPLDALNLLVRLKNRKVKLQNLLLDNVFVNMDFIEVREEILSLKYRKGTVITCGGLVPEFKPKGSDPREIVLNRAEFLCKQSKKNPVDIALVIMQLYKLDKQPMPSKEFNRAVRKMGASNLDEDLLDLMADLFPGPRTPKSKTINLELALEYIKRKWPDRKLPPTPPPELEPEPVKKGKKK